MKTYDDELKVNEICKTGECDLVCSNCPLDHLCQILISFSDKTAIASEWLRGK